LLARLVNPTLASRLFENLLAFFVGFVKRTVEIIGFYIGSIISSFLLWVADIVDHWLISCIYQWFKLNR